MEFLEEETLAEKLRNGALPLAEEFSGLGLTSAEALAVAHRSRHCASRFEAGQHHADSGRREADGLWPGETAGSTIRSVGIGSCATFVYRGGDVEWAEPVESADHGRKHHRNHSIHGSGRLKKKRMLTATFLRTNCAEMVAKAPDAGQVEISYAILESDPAPISGIKPNTLSCV